MKVAISCSNVLNAVWFRTDYDNVNWVLRLIAGHVEVDLLATNLASNTQIVQDAANKKYCC